MRYYQSLDMVFSAPNAGVSLKKWRPIGVAVPSSSCCAGGKALDIRAQKWRSDSTLLEKRFLGPKSA